MTAEPPEQSITLPELADMLAKRDDVLDARICNESERDWCDPWLEVTLDNLIVRSGLCTLLGNTGFGIIDVHPPQVGQTYHEIEIKKDDQ